MDREYLSEQLAQFKKGKISEVEFLDLLNDLPYQDLDFAKVDHHRALRQGFPEVVFGPGKSCDQIEAISNALLEKTSRLLITRTSPDVYDRLSPHFPSCRFHPLSRAITVDEAASSPSGGRVAVVSAGTADLPVAEEAAVTARLIGREVIRIDDVGVAGVHRILSQRVQLRECAVIVTVAGMEGALPSVVAGMVAVPVIAVPTSIGYGAAFEGLAALLGMLNSCAPNVAVVNIDNGFGAGYVAAQIAAFAPPRTAD